jgi:hypothetical protein
MTSMALAAGTRLGPYEIGSSIGPGGRHGQVYKARDARTDPRDADVQTKWTSTFAK